MPGKREIKAREFVADLRSGMNEQELMRKYGLNTKELEIVFSKLIAAKAIKQSEVKGEVAPAAKMAYPEMPSDFRISLREQLDFPLPIYEKDFPESRGLVKDVSNTGLGVRGIEVAVGEVKTLVIPAHELFHVNPIEVEAVCRWVAQKGLSGDLVAGFEILQVLGGSLEDLQILIRSLPLEDRVAMRKKF